MFRKTVNKSSRIFSLILKQNRTRLLIQVALFGLFSYFVIASSLPVKDQFLNIFFSKPSSKAAIEMNKETEFHSNQMLIKISKKARGKLKEGNGQDTGITSINSLARKHKIAKIERVAKTGKKSKVDDDIFDWYLVTFREEAKIVKAEYNKEKKSIEPIDALAKVALARMNDFKTDENIAAVEPNAFVSLMQTVSPTSSSAGCFNAPQLSLQNSSTTANPGQTLTNNLNVYNPNDASCGSTAQLGISVSYPTGSLTVKPAQYSISIKGGETASMPLSITVGSSTVAGSYTYQLWVASWGPVNGTVQVTTEVVPTPTTTPAVTVAATSTPTSTPTPTTPTEITSVIPNDQYYATKSSWGQPYDDMWGMKKLDADKAWSVSTGSPNVVIAVIDTGVDRSHEDLRNNMWVNPNDAPGNGVDDDGNGYIDDYRGWDMFNNDNDPSDDHGHGTLVAGVIDAEGNNGVGVAGVNWHAKIMPMKMIGSGGTGTWSAGASSLIYAADMGAHVSNNSWGTNIYSQIVEDAARYAHDKGMVIVAAAGNSGADMTNVSPAGNEQVISVGAVDINDARTFAHWSSNYGARLDVAAPGVDILSTKSSTGSCVGYPQIGSSYCSVPGTSLSAPFVSGIAGLLLSKYPTLTNEQIRQIIRASAVDIGTTGPDIYYGYGRANIANAMSLATSALPLAPNIRLPIGHSTVSGLQSFIGSAHGSNFAGYKLEAGLGSYPSTWTSLMSSTTPVTESKLADVDTSKLPSGTYTFKLTASTIDNKSYQFQTFGVNVGGSTVNPTPTPTANVSPTISPTNIPGAPQNVTAVGISSSQIQLSWNPPTGGGTIGVYNIYRNGIRIVQGNVLQYTDKNLQPDTAYSYFIRPQYVDGTVGPSSETVTARTLPAATLTPSITIVPTSTPTPTVKSPSSTPTNSPTVTPSPTSAPTPTPDTKAPTVSLSSLSEGATVSGQVTLIATAEDAEGVTLVEFLVDGNVLASLSQAPYATNWDTTILSAGSSHTVSARAYDEAGNIGTSQLVRVTVGDTTPPVVTLTSPENDTTVSESVTIAANAADNLEVQRVEFYVNGILKSSSSSTPYQYVWNSREVDNGTVGISATAYDTAGNKQSDTIVVTVANADITPPSAPANIKAVATSYSTVDITWSPSTDNVGVEGYYIVRNGTTIAQTTSAAYTDSSVQPSTTYQYQIIALDRAGNNSSESATVSVTTPQAPDTDLPTTPGNLSALAVSTSQINLTWDIATDNIGVVGYEVYRNSIKVANVESNSYGDTGLNDSTTYTYYVRAYDATGNMSFSSSSTSATTLTPRTTGDIIGVVSGTDGGEIGGAKVVVYINGSRNTFTTNSFGLYSIFDLTPGTYTLKYSAKGYTTHDDSVVVTAGQTTRKDVTLTVQTSGGGNRPGKR